MDLDSPEENKGEQAVMPDYVKELIFHNNTNDDINKDQRLLASDAGGPTTMFRSVAKMFSPLPVQINTAKVLVSEEQ